MLRVLALALLAACRMNFDPVGDDAGDGIVVGATTGAIHAEPGSDFYRVCAVGVPCAIDCTAAATCYVDCGAAPQCAVTCGPGDCAVAGCASSMCAVDCETGELYSYDDTLTCGP